MSELFMRIIRSSSYHNAVCFIAEREVNLVLLPSRPNSNQSFLTKLFQNWRNLYPFVLHNVKISIRQQKLAWWGSLNYFLSSLIPYELRNKSVIFNSCFRIWQFFVLRVDFASRIFRKKDAVHFSVIKSKKL